MAIEVGKDVVAIENHSKGLFKKGQIFMCLGIKNPICSHSIGLINIGFPIGTERNYCPSCHSIVQNTNGYVWFSIDFFRALDDITPSIEEIIKEIAPLELTQV